MVQRSSPARRRQVQSLGEHVRSWRTLQGISAAELARRAHVTRDTLRSIEEGSGAPRLDSVMAVVSALGFADHWVAAADPLRTESGRSLALDRAGHR